VQPFRKFPAILRNPKVPHRVHKRPPVVPILSEFDPFPTIPSYLYKIHFNIVHPPTSWSSLRSLSIWLSLQYPTCIPRLSNSFYMPCLSHPPFRFYQQQISVIIVNLFLLFSSQLTYLLTYGAEPLLRSCQLCSHSDNSQQF
jgi:hypothetical protein